MHVFKRVNMCTSIVSSRSTTSTCWTVPVRTMAARRRCRDPCPCGDGWQLPQRLRWAIPSAHDIVLDAVLQQGAMVVDLKFHWSTQNTCAWNTCLFKLYTHTCSFKLYTCAEIEPRPTTRGDWRCQTCNWYPPPPIALSDLDSQSSCGLLDPGAPGAQRSHGPSMHAHPADTYTRRYQTKAAL